MAEEKFKDGIGSLKSIKELIESEDDWNPCYPAVEYHVQFLQNTIKAHEEKEKKLLDLLLNLYHGEVDAHYDVEQYLKLKEEVA